MRARLRGGLVRVDDRLDIAAKLRTEVVDGRLEAGDGYRLELDGFLEAEIALWHGAVVVRVGREVGALLAALAEVLLLLLVEEVLVVGDLVET